MVRPEGEGMNNNKILILKNNIKFAAKNLHKQWKVFYRSSYGKAGFYILMIFIVISLLAPVLVHGNPFAAIPSEDYFSPIQELNHPLNFTAVNSSYAITSSESGTSAVSYYLFMPGLSNGTYSIYAISPKNASSTYLFHIDGIPENLYAFSVFNSTTGISQENLMVATNNTIYMGNVVCSYNSLTDSSSVHISNMIKTRSTNGEILSDYTSSKTYALSDPSIISSQFLTSSPLSYVYTLSENHSKYYVNTFYTSNLTHYWSREISIKPTNLYFYGQEFGNPSETRIIITAGDNIYSYNYNGTLEYNDKYNFTISNLIIPSDYQIYPSHKNDAFTFAGKYVYSINIETGKNKVIYSSPQMISALDTSAATTPTKPPSIFMVSTATNVYSLGMDNGTLSVANTIKVPFGVNHIKYYTSGTFLLSNTTSGDIIYLINPSIQYPFSWHASLNKKITAPVLFNNPYPENKSLDDAPAIAILSGKNLIVYSFEGQAAVLPPTSKTLSGISLPLGANNAGNNVWTIFIDSFPTDLEVGFAAGIITIIISVIVSMVIGYYSGILSSFWETVSLAIFLIPGLPLFIVLATILGPTLLNLILIFSLLGWPFVTFSLIGVVRSIKSRVFVESAIVSNLSTTKILRRHILPNMGTLLVYLTSINIGGAVAAVSTYEILGLAPLTIPTWGGMLNGFLGDYYGISKYPWIYVPALLALTLFILAFIFISRGIDEVANPRLGGRK